MAHAMLRLLAKPKITAVFWESLILESSVVSSQHSVKKGNKNFCFFSPCALFPAISRQRRGSNAMERLLNFFHGIAQHHCAAVRTAHLSIGLCQRVQQLSQLRCC